MDCVGCRDVAEAIETYRELALTHAWENHLDSESCAAVRKVAASPQSWASFIRAERPFTCGSNILDERSDQNSGRPEIDFAANDESKNPDLVSFVLKSLASFAVEQRFLNGTEEARVVQTLLDDDKFENDLGLTEPDNPSDAVHGLKVDPSGVYLLLDADTTESNNFPQKSAMLSLRERSASDRDNIDTAIYASMDSIGVERNPRKRPRSSRHLCPNQALSAYAFAAFMGAYVDRCKAQFLPLVAINADSNADSSEVYRTAVAADGPSDGFKAKLSLLTASQGSERHKSYSVAKELVSDYSYEISGPDKVDLDSDSADGVNDLSWQNLEDRAQGLSSSLEAARLASIGIGRPRCRASAYDGFGGTVAEHGRSQFEDVAMGNQVPRDASQGKENLVTSGHQSTDVVAAGADNGKSAVEHVDSVMYSTDDNNGSSGRENLCEVPPSDTAFATDNPLVLATRKYSELASAAARCVTLAGVDAAWRCPPRQGCSVTTSQPVALSSSLPEYASLALPASIGSIPLPTTLSNYNCTADYATTKNSKVFDDERTSTGLQPRDGSSTLPENHTLRRRHSSALGETVEILERARSVREEIYLIHDRQAKDALQIVKSPSRTKHRTGEKEKMERQLSSACNEFDGPEYVVRNVPLNCLRDGRVIENGPPSKLSCGQSLWTETKVGIATVLYHEGFVQASDLAIDILADLVSEFVERAGRAFASCRERIAANGPAKLCNGDRMGRKKKRTNQQNFAVSADGYLSMGNSFRSREETMEFVRIVCSLGIRGGYAELRSHALHVIPRAHFTAQAVERSLRTKREKLLKSPHRRRSGSDAFQQPMQLRDEPVIVPMQSSDEQTVLSTVAADDNTSSKNAVDASDIPDSIYAEADRLFGCLAAGFRLDILDSIFVPRALILKCLSKKPKSSLMRLCSPEPASSTNEVVTKVTAEPGISRAEVLTDKESKDMSEPKPDVTMVDPENGNG